MENKENITNIKIQGYEDKMLKAFVGGEEKTFYKYKKIFARFEANGIEKFALSWSWWELFFGVLNTLYRKLYFLSFIQILVNIFLIPFCNTLICFLSNIIFCVIVNFASFQRYKRIKNNIENNIKDEEKRIETMYLFNI